MKTLSKLNINPEKLMKDEELLVLRGGYDSYCACKDSSDFTVCSTFFETCDGCANWCSKNCWPAVYHICAGL